MVAAIKSRSGLSPAEQYRQFREYQQAFWEWITEVIYAEGIEGDEAVQYVYQVGLAMLTVHPTVNG